MDYQEIARWLMYEFLGRRWVWPEVTATDVFFSPARTFHLPGRPVRAVTSVHLGDEKITDYELSNGFVLTLPDRCWDLWEIYGYWYGQGDDPFPKQGCRKELTVVYKYGSPAPVGVERAIDILAEEMQLAFCGDPACRLPSRTQSISRQGIDVQLFDAEDFLDNGRTGLVEVDLVLRTYNSTKSRARSRVISSTHPPSRRTSTTQEPIV